MSTKRLLVVGASGYLGSALCVGLREHYEVFGTYFNNPIRLDGVTTASMNCVNGGEIIDLLKKIKPDVVLFAAGITDVDSCETQPQLAETLNFQAPSLFFKAFTQPPRFIYFSTDQVFSGAKGHLKEPYTEADTPDPINLYGETKAKGEGATAASPLGCVVRLALLYGEPFGKTQTSKEAWTSWMQKLLEKKQPVPLYNDQIRSPVYIGDIIRATRKLIENPNHQSKIYNFAGPTAVSRFDLGKIFCEHMKFSSEYLRGVPFSSDKARKARRPSYAVLSAELFEKEFDFHFQTPFEGMLEYAQRLKTGHTSSWTF